MMSAIRRGLDTTIGVTARRPAVRGKLLDLAFVGATAVLVLLAVVAGFLPELVQGGAAWSLVSASVPLALWIATALALYRVGPSETIGTGGLVAGAITAAVLVALVSVASDLVYSKTAEWTLIYGSLTTILVFLYSIYLYAAILLLGAAVATEWER